jgi:hypothetical protein
MADNPKFWIEALRTNAHCHDCAEKRLVILNAADAFERISEQRRLSDIHSLAYASNLRDEKHELQDDNATLRAENQALRDENARLMRGEFICQKCGLRKDAESGGDADF